MPAPPSGDFGTRSGPVMTSLGTHLLVDLYGVAPELLRDEPLLLATLGGALEDSGFRVLQRVAHRFDSGGFGVTGVFLLRESHLAFHSYPEHGYLALDLFSCGVADPAGVLDAVERSLRPTAVDVAVQERGRRVGAAGRLRTAVASR